MNDVKVTTFTEKHKQNSSVNMQDNNISFTEPSKITPYCNNYTEIKSEALDYHLSALSIDKDIIAWIKLHKGVPEFLNKILQEKRLGEREYPRLLLY
jgi:hypothetical protein